MASVLKERRRRFKSHRRKIHQVFITGEKKYTVPLEIIFCMKTLKTQLVSRSIEPTSTMTTEKRTAEY